MCLRFSIPASYVSLANAFIYKAIAEALKNFIGHAGEGHRISSKLVLFPARELSNGNVGPPQGNVRKGLPRRGRECFCMAAALALCLANLSETLNSL